MVVDTNVFIEFLRARNKIQTTLFSIGNNEQIYVSSITLFELYTGATSEEKLTDIKILTENVPVIPFNEEVAVRAAKLYQQLKGLNQMIEIRDLFIAATCLIYNFPLKTLNKKHFQRIENLKVL